MGLTLLFIYLFIFNCKFLTLLAEAKTCFGKTVKSSSSSSGGLVSEQKGKVRTLITTFIFLKRVICHTREYVQESGLKVCL